MFTITLLNVIFVLIFLFYYSLIFFLPHDQQKSNKGTGIDGKLQDETRDTNPLPRQLEILDVVSQVTRDK